MLGAIKHFIKFTAVPILYLGGFGIMWLSIVKEALWGFYLLVSLIPNANIWYKFHSYPLGTDFLDLLYVAVVIGI